MKAIWNRFRHLWQSEACKSRQPRPVRLALEALEDRRLLSVSSTLGGPLAGSTTTIKFDGIPIGAALTNQFHSAGLDFAGLAASAPPFAGQAASAPTPVTEMVQPGGSALRQEVASIPTGTLSNQAVPGFRGFFSSPEAAVGVEVGELAVAQGTDSAVLTIQTFDASGKLVATSKPVTVTAGAGVTTVLVALSGPLNGSSGNIKSFMVTARPQDANKPLVMSAIEYQAPGVGGSPAPFGPPSFTYTPDNLKLVIHPGETIKDHITIAFHNSPGGPVQFTATGLPQGVTATFVPSTDVPPPPTNIFGQPQQGVTMGAADMILSAAGNAPTTYESPVGHLPSSIDLSALTLTAKSVDGKAGPGVYGDSGYYDDTGLPYTFPIQLEVRPQYFADVYSLSNNYEADLGNVLPGREIDGYVKVTREPNFSGPVTLSFKGLPAGVQELFSASTLEPGNTQTGFSLRFATNVSWGAHSITLEANSGFLAPVEVPLTLTVQDPIQAKYQELQQQDGISLGNALGPEARTTDGQGVVQGFQYGTKSSSWNSYIYWWPTTGAHEIEGNNYQQYKLMDQAQGPLGRLTQDEFVPHYIEDAQYTLRSVFEHGAIQDDSYSSGLPNLTLVAFKLNDTTMRFYWTSSQYYDFFQVRYAMVGQPDTQVTINQFGTARYFDLGGLAVNMPYHFSVQGATNKGFLQGASYTDWAQPIFVSSGNFTPPTPPSSGPPSGPPQNPDKLPELSFYPNALGEGITLNPIFPNAGEAFTVSWTDYNFSDNNAGAYVDRLVVYKEQDNAPSEVVYDSSAAAPDSLKVNQLGAGQSIDQSVSFDTGLPTGLYTFEVTLNYNQALKEYNYNIDTHTSDAYNIDFEPATRLPAVSGQSSGTQVPATPLPIPANTPVATSFVALATSTVSGITPLQPATAAAATALQPVSPTPTAVNVFTAMPAASATGGAGAGKTPAFAAQVSAGAAGPQTALPVTPPLPAGAIATALTDVTAQLAISLGSLTLNPTTKHYVQTVTLKNTSASPITGPLSLALDNLSSNVKLVNQTGVTTKQGPVGSPYLDVALTGNVLAAGQSVTVVLEFDSPTAAITYKARVLAGTGQR
jgi:hypothetical protein